MNIIKKIEIQHFRSINNIFLDEVADFNVFAGTNDSGKSNLLRALNLFFNGESSFLVNYNFNDDYSKLALFEARQKKKGRQFISIKIFLNEDVIQGKDQLKKLAKKNGGLWVKREWWKYEDTYRETLPDYISKASQGLKRSFSVLLSEIKFIYIPAFKDNEVFSHVLSMVGNEEGIFINQQAKDELNKQIATSASDLAKDFSELTGISTKVSLPITLDSFWASLQVATDFKKMSEIDLKRGRAEDYLIGLIARGEGIKSIFTPIILGWLANKIKKRYWVWGIDEPENSLESKRTIALYKKFLDYSKVAQIFVSSHSPVFIFPSIKGRSKTTLTFVATQKNEGDTKFKEISTSDSNLREKLIRQFGVDYGTFLVMQNDYAKKLQETETARDEITKKLAQVNRPVIFVEGELDEKYFKKAIEVLCNGAYLADIRWIGTREGGGQARFTGKSALEKFEAFVIANPNFSHNKIVLLYDVEVNKSRSENNNLLVMSPSSKAERNYQTGTEHLLVFPNGFDYSPYTIERDERRGDTQTTIKEPDKKKLCDYVCSQLNIEEQKVFLADINNLLTTLKSFFSTK